MSTEVEMPGRDLSEKLDPFARAEIFSKFPI